LTTASLIATILPILKEEAPLAVAAPVRPTTITIKEAAERLDVHENTVRNWIDRQILDSYRLPSGHRRLPLAEVERVEEEVFGAPTSFADVETTKAPRTKAGEPVTGQLP
jgi:excisionase family DNA binding protein